MRAQSISARTGVTRVIPPTAARGMRFHGLTGVVSRTDGCRSMDCVRGQAERAARKQMRRQRSAPSSDA
eukprot:3936755-Rhodomonas_salina.1